VLVTETQTWESLTSQLLRITLAAIRTGRMTTNDDLQRLPCEADDQKLARPEC